jgi:hypothetical protein
MIKLYVDMDQVVTDFASAVKAIGAESGLPDDAPEEDKARLRQAVEEAGEQFWAKMGWAPGGKELWAFLKPLHPVLLSSPGEFRDAPSGKQAWVNENVPGTTLICEPEKYAYAERNAILIDDLANNIESWKEAGGRGILHTSFEDTKAKLEEILSEPQMQATLANEIRRLASFSKW